ncbi:bifunctional 4-hydroxy-2-oxoglutarate aldolase/2-dehydro-3-deoxy-phosphogluconate aldolase [Cellulophaga lytica]|uniref:KDPG and KHG aldolase n=1 Tax=Cellulophaga lytica (strain ATCC 23178 / DSM 7489 / JCM 8516 / NBRC 14961 / NCIMB 1423 / VKM B-1433 / Cy l20) TaxID=867900 RepID=F0RGX8_CELLC|nr:bifunctional 4-hydroxy-2-oxoglutarate aldolase/2-dehydro-3-deoxy-phosphogluconate aldolase [Cellulophaga lytica]ADY30182.1 KDPG and KHG aldolase [Cellulophaga lytica DSM 7489]WQG78882.1 bifunctional 4-hydroxy-2-oxoglutarate aldolase/2-dehydro-3-deoxy-phosphogluconate aldolase [Cellulophaga lytica]
MAQYSRIEVFNTMNETGLVPLFYHSDVDLAKNILKACYNGGARLMEFTARGDFAFEVFSELNKYAIKELPGMVLGVGSVTDAAAASLYMQMGANFIVTPSFREDIAIACNRRKVMWSPGCGSLKEINTAEELGCEVVKLFPGATYGAGFVKAIKGPQPWTNVMPTGGVTTEEDNLTAWFNAGVTCVGIGSKLISKDVIANKDYKGLEATVKQTIAVIKKLKKK